MTLTDQTAVVTGSARGIGREIAEKLAASGAAITVVDIDQGSAEKTAAEIADKYSVKTLAFGCDVSSMDQAAEVVDSVIKEQGRLDILVNNAGITRDSLIMRMKPEDWELVLRVNLTGSFNFIRSASRQMTRQRAGSIVNIASVVGLMGNPGQANYSASKAGLIGLTKTAAKEFAPRGVRVNAVAPGFIETEMTANLDDAIKSEWHKIIPLGRSGFPEDVAKAVLFLAGPDSSYITGQVLQIDGGMIMS